MGARGATGYVLGRGAGGAAYWWEAGGATGIVAAYQPKGAASLAASYVNLANPGTYDAAPGVAPTWDAATGWSFNGTTQYLTTGVRMYHPYTSIIRIVSANSPSTTDDSFGIVETSPSVIQVRLRLSSATSVLVGNGASTTTINVASQNNRVYAIAGANAYVDGAFQAALDGSWSYDPNPSGGAYIGARNYRGAPNNPAECQIAAFAIYSATLSAAQVAAVTAAMNLL